VIIYTIRSLGEGNIVLVEGRSNGSEFDVREGHRGIWTVLFDVVWLSRVSRAGSSLGSVFGGSDWIGGVEPEHVNIMVVPDRQNQDHTVFEGLAHLGDTSFGRELVDFFEVLLDGSAEVVRDRVVLLSVDGGGWSLNHFSSLDVLSSDFVDSSVVSSVVGNELSDDGEWHGGINFEVASRSKESLGSVSEGSEVASISIAKARVSIGVTAVVSSRSIASFGRIVRARMSSEGLGDRVSFPNVELHAAGSVFPSSSIWVGRIAVPSLRVGLTIDKLDVSWALGIAISSSIVGSSVVSRELRKSTISWHLGEVKSSIETTWQLGNINIKGEFSVDKLEHLVLVSTHEVVSRSNILAILCHGDESEFQGISISKDTIGVVPGVFVDSVNGAVFGTFDIIWAERAVPRVASVAVGVSTVVVEPSPVGVEHNGSYFVVALSSVALFPGKGQVLFLGVVSNLLGRGDSSKGSKGKSHFLIIIIISENISIK